MLIREAKRVCPEVIIELGEDIGRFRDASKELYKNIEAYTWNGKVERLGFDEVWLDVTDMIDYNMEVLNRNDLKNAYFQMTRDDPEKGFHFDATFVAGHTQPAAFASSQHPADELTLRLILGSHLALHMRRDIEQHKGYTSTVGIATNKLLSKLVGSLNKPNGQTTLMPPLHDIDPATNNAMAFLDEHEIGKVPGIGFKLAQKLRAHVLKRPADFDKGLVYGTTRESINVLDVRQEPDVNPEMLEKLLSGPGAPHGIGWRIWCLLHAIDDTEVHHMRPIPRQISIEDSYIRLDTMPEVLKELYALSKSLLTRMRIDLLGLEDDFEDDVISEETDQPAVVPVAGKKWLAHPKTLRLTTRPRQALQFDGTRPRSFKRISHSGPLPTFVFKLSDSIETHAEKLVREVLVGMFQKLHPEKSGWNLSLVNLAVTNMAETAGDTRTANGRDIGNMFKKQDEVLKDFTVIESDDALDMDGEEEHEIYNEGAYAQDTDMEQDWESEGETDAEAQQSCSICGQYLPAFAISAHERYHSMHDPIS